MLATHTQQQLNQLGIQATHANEFVSGLKLMQLVCLVFYNGQNKSLTEKLIASNDSKTGVDVVNISIILKILKNDPKIQLREDIRKLTPFKIIEEEKIMVQFIEWILSNVQYNQPQKRFQQELSPLKEQQNEFQNLYFVSSMQKKDYLPNDSLEEENPQDRVVRKGSFKVLKPKASTASKNSSEEKSREDSLDFEKRNESINRKEPLKELILVQPNQLEGNEDKDDLQCRKTIPKMYEKPPLCRPRKEPKSSQKQEQEKQSTSEVATKRVVDRQQLLQNIQNITKQIEEEEKSISLTCADQPKTQQSTRKPSRKIFKIDIPQIQEKKKKMLVQWLIAINLLNASSTKFVDQLQSICKDGVVFVEAVNYYCGRGKELCYFKQPKRAAEIHSNYQKLFTFLNQQVDFRSQLLHMYEYFVPEAQPNAFWSMLASIHQCFNKRVKPRQSNINRYENSISKKLERQSSKKKSLNQSASYQEIKYNSASVKKEPKSISSAELPRKETPTPNRPPPYSTETTAQQSVAPYELIQNEEPAEDIFRSERGYKEMYLNKFKNIETPKKHQSFHNSSLSKSRMRLSMGSSKKKECKPVIPSINLQMQMGVLKYLQEFEVQQQQELFKDPFRNGLLICQVIQQHLGIQCFASRRPKNIQDCRNNFALAIETLKTHKQHFNVNFQFFIQEFLKGERTLLHGLIWEVIRPDQREAKINASLDLQTNPNEEGLVTWVRSVERNYPNIGEFKIRSNQSLFHAITSTNFLFQYSWFITGKKAVTPTYEYPINEIQKESNLKKVLGYLVQSKIIRSDYLWKAKSLLKNESSLLKELVQDLASHYNHLYQKQQGKMVNFVKYLKRDDNDSREKPQEKLQTTMANQTIVQQPQQEQPKLEVPWMRKLGFPGNLELNNGVVLCRLMAKLNMKTIEGFNQRPQSRAECLGNIRKAIKNIPKFRWDQYDILDSDNKRALEIFAFIKERYKHAYAMKAI